MKLQKTLCVCNNGVLMGKWRPHDVSVDDEQAIKNQIVIPKIYREE